MEAAWSRSRCRWARCRWRWLLGLLIAVGRLYGPVPVGTVLAGYVELIRGTPLMLQLFVLFFLLKLPPWVAGIGGLAINYSAYEAEIYRAGLQAIPRARWKPRWPWECPAGWPCGA